ncbi:right-handed parallel beta-helix repeat-containing protein [Coleofasciculus sp. F4-SAH-05]|uniref:right-handed parallel beta-helix repeat-containing protein n=1 Tax=Coleofasciculus sp. F4-SAH-05 TaxID=3069525 RepID=UPI0032FC2D2C
MSQVFTVQNRKDSGQGSLRDAIAQAQSGDTIKFASGLKNKTIKLTSGQLEIDKDLTIDGSKAQGLKISGNNAHRIFDIKRDAGYNSTEFTLRNLNLVNGKTNKKGADGAGAAIRTDSYTTLTVENSEFRNNYANGEGGGAIFAGWRSNTTVINSEFENNRTSGNSQTGKSERGGGAIAVGSESSLTVKDSEFTDNTGINGGAINTVLGGLTVENSTFTDNDSTPGGKFGPHTKGYGGAIYTDGASATTNSSTKGKIEISNSRFEGNKGAGQGGGLFLYAYPGDEVIIEDSTIIDNQVIKDAKGDALGGGVRHGNSKLTVRNTTFANNRALVQGGGLWTGEKSPVTIDNSIFYDNEAKSTNGKSGLGGAILLGNGSSQTKITSTTVANNYAGWQGGGFWGGGNNVTLKKTLVADNVANNGGNKWNIYHHTGKVFRDGGGNFQSEDPNPNDTKVTAKAKLLDPQLGDFTDNGGAVQTAPIPGNPEVTGGATLTPTAGGNSVSNNELQLVAAVAEQTAEVDEPLSFDGNNQDTTPAQNDSILITEGEPELINLDDQTSSVSAKFFNIESDAGFNNSVGFYAVENEQGDVKDKVTGELISPDEAGYAEAALAQQVVGDMNRNTGIFEAEFQAGTILAPYIIANGTTEEWLETNPNNQRLGYADPTAYFAYLGANPDGKDHVSLLGENKFGFEDWFGGGDMDHDDITFEVDLTVA